MRLFTAQCHMIGAYLDMDGIMQRRTTHEQDAYSRAKSHVTETLSQHSFGGYACHNAARHHMHVI